MRPIGRSAVRRLNPAVILYSLNDREAALREIEMALEIFRKDLPPGHLGSPDC